MKTAALSNKINDHVLNIASYPQPTLLMRLYTAAVGSDASGWTEVTGGGYSAQSIPTAFAASASNAAATDEAISFGPSTAAWSGDIVAWTIEDSVTSDILYQGYMVASNRPFAARASDDFLVSPDHGLSNGDTVIVQKLADFDMPVGVTQGTIYYVVNLTSTAVQLSATLGGSPVDLTDDGFGWVGEIAPATVGAANITYRVPIAGLTIKEF